MARLRPVHVVAVALMMACPLRPAAASDDTACAEAGMAAELRHGIPPGLLLAIGQVESGRRLPGGTQPWPWTIDAAGSGQFFASLPPALATVQALQARGVASIDVGCFQINLAAHPQAFSRLEQAFDPAANADYASRFLLLLKQRLGDWGSAVAAYHSATPGLGAAYRELVMAAWGHPAAGPLVAGAGPVVPGVRVVSWAPVGGGIHVWTPGGAMAANVISLPGGPALPAVQTARH